jgi:exosortase D (VPLPA-CTERM-specific)
MRIWVSYGHLVLLLAPLLWLYFPTFQYMVKRLTSSQDLNYAFLIPFIFVYLIWEKRGRLRSIPLSPSWAGLVPCILGLALFWLGELGGEYYTQYIAFMLLLAGSIWISLGFPYTKALGFPLTILVMMFPLPHLLIQTLTARLQLLSSQVGVVFLHFVGKSAYREGNIIDLGLTKLQVVEACSGLRYLLPLLVLTLLLGHFTRRSLWQRVVLFFSAFPIAVLINALRIALTGVLSEIWGVQATEGFFHDFEGFFIFMLALGFLMLMLSVLALFSRGSRHGARSEPQSHAAVTKARRIPTRPAVSGPFFVMLALLSLSCIAYSAVEFREKVPVVRPLSEFPMQIGKWSGTRMAMEQQFIDTLDLSDYVLADYMGPGGHAINLYTAYYESQRKGESIHSPATCLQGSGWTFLKAGPLRIETPGLFGGSITVHSALLHRNDQKQMVLYWFQKGGRILDNVYLLKWFVFWDALTQQRTDGALVRVITSIAEDEDPDAARARLAEFIQEALPDLTAFLPGTKAARKGGS